MRGCADYFGQHLFADVKVHWLFLLTFFVQHSFVDAKVRWLSWFWLAPVRRCEGVLTFFCWADYYYFSSTHLQMQRCAHFFLSTLFVQHSFVHAKVRFLSTSFCSALVRRCEGALIIIILPALVRRCEGALTFFCWRFFVQHLFIDARVHWLFSIDMFCSALVRRCEGALIIIILVSTRSQMQRCTDFFLLTFFVQHSFVDVKVHWLLLFWPALVHRCKGALTFFCQHFLFSTRS